LKEYYDYYKYERPETQYNCDILNSVTNVKWVNVETYNAMKIKEDPTFRPVKLERETNPHHISHYIRSLAENSNIIEQIKYTFDDDNELGYIKTRPLIDINSTRTLKAGLDPEILTPINETADRDRKLKCLNAIEGFDKKINQLLNKTEMDAAKMVLEQFEYDKKYQKRQGEDGYTVIERPEFTNLEQVIDNAKNQREEEFETTHSDHNLNEYLIRGENDHPLEPNTLINLTDVIYYLTNEQLYEAAQNLNDGVIIVGTAHVPKYLDTQEHLIQFGDKVEGKVIITPNRIDNYAESYNHTDCTMVMKMEGNQYPYIHSLNHLLYISPDMNSKIIISGLMGTPQHNYLLKCVPIEKFDSGATYYIRFQIIKISNPRAEDIVTEDFIGYEMGSYLQKVRSELNQHKPLFSIINELYDLKLNPGASVHNYHRNHLNIKIANIWKPILKENLLPKKKRIITHEIVKEEVFLQDGKYYFTKRTKDEKVNAIRVLRMKKDDLTEYIATIDKAVNPKLINKLTNKMILAQKLDVTTIKSLISYIQKEDPSLNIPNQVIPLLAKVMQETLRTEKNIATLMTSSLSQTLQDFKNGEYKLERYEIEKLTIFDKIKRAITELFYTPTKIIETNADKANQNF
jgi:hypothetical protein